MNIGSTSGSSLTTPATAVVQSSEQLDKQMRAVVDATTQRPVEKVDELSESMIDMKQGQQLLDANAKVIQAADRNLGNLLDTEA